MKKWAERLPLRLSIAQRAAILEEMSSIGKRLGISKDGPDVLELDPSLTEVLRCNAQHASRVAQDSRRRRSLELVAALAKENLKRFHEVDAIPKSERLYQLRISLDEIEPEIWRRVQIKDCTLDRLHRHIQGAMGWKDSHLYRFEIAGIEYSFPYPDDDIEFEDSTSLRMSEFLPKDGHPLSFSYVYDFGDSWSHTIRYEGCLRATPPQVYPLCVEGARACPPEDVGGVRGYGRFLEAILNPAHEEHEYMRRWSGRFDPESFDAVAASRRMSRSGSSK